MDKRSVDLYEQRNAVTLTVKMGADRNKASYLRIVACKIALEPAPTQYLLFQGSFYPTASSLHRNLTNAGLSVHIKSNRFKLVHRAGKTGKPTQPY